jgi:glycosyltransferase involved in cell wall biosynthesis
MPSRRTRPLRIVYAAGFGNVIGTFRRWLEGREDPTEVAITYSEQFFDVCAGLNAEALVVASRLARYPRDTLAARGIRVVHRTNRWASKSGLSYHFWQLWEGLRILVTVIAYRADVAVVCDGTCPWFMLRVLPWLGTSVIPTLHCIFYTGDSPRGGMVNRVIRGLDRPFWRRSAAGVLSVSRDVTRQLATLSGGVHSPVFEFLPTYRERSFEGTSAMPAQRIPFRVLSAGRIERAKGVFELLEVARRLHAEGRQQIEFELCGDGSALEELRARVREAGLESAFHLHGQCDRPTMLEMFRNSHVVIVPTIAAAGEGLAKIVVEGVLACRPVITSSVCPAIEYVGDAVVVVPADDVGGYHEAIVSLHDDTQLYERKRQACLHVQRQFYEFSRGWGAAFARALALVSDPDGRATVPQQERS